LKMFTLHRPEILGITVRRQLNARDAKEGGTSGF
jgi:hypothetical protein